MTRQLWLSRLIAGMTIVTVAGCVFTPRGQFSGLLGDPLSVEVAESKKKVETVSSEEKKNLQARAANPEEKKPVPKSANEDKSKVKPVKEVKVIPPAVAITTVTSAPDRVAGSPSLTEPPLLKMMRHYLEQEPGDALRELKKLDPEQRRILMMLLPLAVRASEKKISEMDPKELAATLEQLNQIRSAIQNRAALQLKKMCFCHTIERFGVYNPIEGSPVFEMGTKGRPGELVQIYVEVANFTSILRRSLYETTFSVRFEISNQTTGKVIWKSEENRVGPEQSRARRQDCFLNCYFRIPAELAVGQYTLRLMVSDVTELIKDGKVSKPIPMHRTVSQTLDFEVKAYAGHDGR